MGFDDPGGPDVLRPETLPVPEPGENQVLICVSHAGINRPDVIQRQGFKLIDRRMLVAPGDRIIVQPNWQRSGRRGQ